MYIIVPLVDIILIIKSSMPLEPCPALRNHYYYNSNATNAHLKPQNLPGSRSRSSTSYSRLKWFRWSRYPSQNQSMSKHPPSVKTGQETASQTFLAPSRQTKRHHPICMSDALVCLEPGLAYFKAAFRTFLTSLPTRAKT